MPAWAIGELRPYAVVKRVWSAIPPTVPDFRPGSCPGPDSGEDGNAGVGATRGTAPGVIALDLGPPLSGFMPW